MGGAAALARAHDYLRGHPDGHVLVVAVELPTLSFQHDDVSTAQLVSTALFGDGAAAALLTGRPTERGVSILATESHLFPDTLDALGFELRDDGFHVLLSKDVPEQLHAGADPRGRRPARAGRAGPSRPALLRASPRRAAHPRARSRRRWASSARYTQPSWDVLRDHGNVSSAAILFVLDRWLKNHPPSRGAPGLLGAFGPGLSTELCVLQWN